MNTHELDLWSAMFPPRVRSFRVRVSRDSRPKLFYPLVASK